MGPFLLYGPYIEESTLLDPLFVILGEKMKKNRRLKGSLRFTRMRGSEGCFIFEKRKEWLVLEEFHCLLEGKSFSFERNLILKNGYGLRLHP